MRNLQQGISRLEAVLGESGTSGLSGHTKLRRLDAHTVRLEPEQWAALNELVRRIMAGRSAENRTERITESTLIRIAIRLLCGLGFHAEDIGNENELARRVLGEDWPKAFRCEHCGKVGRRATRRHRRFCDARCAGAARYRYLRNGEGEHGALDLFCGIGSVFQCAYCGTIAQRTAPHQRYCTPACYERARRSRERRKREGHKRSGPRRKRDGRARSRPQRRFDKAVELEKRKRLRELIDRGELRHAAIAALAGCCRSNVSQMAAGWRRTTDRVLAAAERLAGARSMGGDGT